MITKESLQKALDLKQKALYSSSGGDILTPEEYKEYQNQIIGAFNLAKIAGLELDHYEIYEEHILKIALFLIDIQRIKEWLSRLNNKAFW